MLRRTTTRRLSLPQTDFKAPAYTGPSYDQILKMRQQHIMGVHGLWFKEPVLFTQGNMQYLFDHKGERYLDMFAGVATVGCGHSHPRITEVVKKQAEKINHTTYFYLQQEACEYAQALCAKLPNQGENWQLHLTNSGSEANDFAMLMARHHTGNHQVFTLRGGYHGLTEGARGMVGVKNWKHKVASAGGVTRALCPHPLRGLLGTKPEDVDKYVADLEAQIFEETPGRVAGMWIERIQGVGGAAELLPGYQAKAFEVIKKHGGIAISDEVQCGFGRLGTHYWGCEIDGAKPDILVMAKSVANGWPMGIVAVRKEIAESMKGVNYISTYGANAMSCVVAHETLKIIDDEKLMENSHAQGTHMINRLKEMQKKHECIAQVRGRGLLYGFELVTNRDTLEPASALAGNLIEWLKVNKVLVGKGGQAGNVVRVAPPMCVTKADSDYLCDAIDQGLTELTK